MSNLKKFGIVLVAAFALTAIAASSASAQLFTASVTGALNGMSTTSEVFNDTANNGGGNVNKITCNTATVTGTIALSSHNQTVTINYSSSANNACTAFIGTANVSTANFIFTGAVSNSSNTLDNVNVDIENAINISTSLGCNVQIPAQNSVNSVTIENDSGSIIDVASSQNINSTGNGGLCGNAHTGGSAVGSATISSAGTLNFDITG